MISTDWVNEGPSDKWIHAFGIKQGKLSCDLAMNRYSKLFEREKLSFLDFATAFVRWVPIWTMSTKALEWRCNDDELGQSAAHLLIVFWIHFWQMVKWEVFTNLLLDIRERTCHFTATIAYVCISSRINNSVSWRKTSWLDKVLSQPHYSMQHMKAMTFYVLRMKYIYPSVLKTKSTILVSWILTLSGTDWYWTDYQEHNDVAWSYTRCWMFLFHLSSLSISQEGT